MIRPRFESDNKHFHAIRDTLHEEVVLYIAVVVNNNYRTNFYLAFLINTHQNIR